MAATVLIVEDSEPTAEILREVIRELPDVYVAVAADAGEALEALRGLQFDLLVLDVMLPGMSGLELYEELRKSDRCNSSVLFITADKLAYRRIQNDPDMRAVSYVMPKPLDLDEFRTSVAGLLA